MLFPWKYKPTIKLIRNIKLILKKNYKHKLPYRVKKKRYKLIPSFTSKSRTVFKINYLRNFFNYGKVGYFFKTLVIITEKFYLRLVLLLKRVIRKRDKTLRRFWITPFTPLYISATSKGARMGKGKGKKLFKISYITSIRNFIELKGLRSGRALYYKKVLSSRTPSNLSLRLKFTPDFNNTYFK